MIIKRIVYLIILELLLVEACTPQSPTGTNTPTQSPATTQTTTVLLPVISGVSDQTQVFGTPSPQPTLTTTSKPAIGIKRTPGTEEVDKGISPAYDVYISKNFTGAVCGWDTNAGGFSRLAWVSVFYNVRFSIPPAGWPSDEQFPGDIATGDQESTSEIADYAFCPTYEGDQVYQCFLTVGPHPFETGIYVDIPDPDELPPVSLVETPDPLDDGPVMDLHYYIWGSTIGDIIIRAGDGHLGDCDGIGGPFLLPPYQTFPISWQRVVLGEEFSKEFGYQYDDGSTETYTVHFIPVINK
jgi:hypothetical protein